MEEKKITDVRIGEYLTEDVSACVGKRSHIYVDKFYKVHDNGYSFNWCAALFAQTWFGYRKMWKGAAIITGVNLILSAITQTITIATTHASYQFAKYYMVGQLAVTLILIMVCGIAGDWYYCKHVTKILDDNHCKGRAAIADPVLEQRLRNAGGVSFPGIFAVWIINLSLSRLVALLVIEIAAHL